VSDAGGPATGPGTSGSWRPHLPRAIDSLHRRHGDPRFHIDWLLVFAAAAITGFGLVNIYAARYQWTVDNGVDSYVYVRRQLIAIGLGVLAAVVVAVVDYRRWREFALVFFAASAGALALVAVAGKEINGARAWFEFGGFQLQPAEFAKVTLVLAVAAYASLGRGMLRARELALALGIAAVPGALIMLQPDLGTAMVFGAVVMAVLLIAGAQMRHVVVVCVLGVVMVVAVLGTNQLKDYQINRLTAFVSPSGARPGTQATRAERNLEAVRANLRESQTAIGSGGLHGKGFLNGTQTNGKFVPEQHTEFIFSAVGEQFGFVGSTALLGCFALLATRLWRTAKLSRDLFGSLLCVGVLAWMVFQVFENVGMAMGIMPVTGIPLPLMSYGGSSTIAFLIGLGLVCNVHMRQYT
jgi:rod shape determining protein RodA